MRLRPSPAAFFEKRCHGVSPLVVKCVKIGMKIVPNLLGNFLTARVVPNSYAVHQWKCNFSMVKRSVLQLTLRVRQDKTHTCGSRYRSTVHSEITGQELHHSVYLINVLKFYACGDYFVDTFYPRTKLFLFADHTIHPLSIQFSL